MKRSKIKQLVVRLQRTEAKLDVALGNPPRKKSASYINAYAQAYEREQIQTANSAQVYL